MVTLNLASMIDVTFLLLLYFLVTTVLARPEDRLSSSLQTRSESAAGPSADFQPQIVDVLMLDGRPAFRLGPRVLRDKASLTSVLRELPKSAGLFVHVFDDAPSLSEGLSSSSTHETVFLLGTGHSFSRFVDGVCHRGRVAPR